MPDGGQLTIETANIVFDQDGAAKPFSVDALGAKIRSLLEAAA